MKKIKIFVLFAVGFFVASSTQAVDDTFSVFIRIISQMQVVNSNSMSFPKLEPSKIRRKVTVSPNDGGAATFDIRGENGYGISASVVEPSVDLKNNGITPSGITIDGFTFGGGLDTSGIGDLSGESGAQGTSGILTANIGATENLPGGESPGAYEGQMTFRVLYQ